MLMTGFLKWESIDTDQLISLSGVLGMFVSNRGDVAFDFCGQVILPGKRIQIPIFGTPVNINQHISFKNNAGIKRAILEYTQTELKNNNLCEG